MTDMPPSIFPTDYNQARSEKKSKILIITLIALVVALVAGLAVYYTTRSPLTATPTRDAVKKGVEQIYDKEINTVSFAEEVATSMDSDEGDVKAFLDKSRSDFAECVTGIIYDKVTEETKNDLANAQLHYSKEDVTTIENTIGECSKKLGENYIASLPEPTKEEFINGVKEIFKTTINTPEMIEEMVGAGYDEEKVKDFLNTGDSDFAECVATEIYDTISTYTKHFVAQGSDKQSEDDTSRIKEAGSKCMVEASKKHGLGTSEDSNE